MQTSLAPHSSPDLIRTARDRRAGEVTDKEFLEALSSAGIEVPEQFGAPSVIAAYDNVRGTEKEHALAEILCRYTASPGAPKFYETKCWLRARYLTLVAHGNRCQCCGISAADGAVLQIDHIKPRSKYPALALAIDNLQVLCRECNIGKDNKDETDWR